MYCSAVEVFIRKTEREFKTLDVYTLQYCWIREAHRKSHYFVNLLNIIRFDFRTGSCLRGLKEKQLIERYVVSICSPEERVGKMSDSLPYFYWKMRFKLTSLKSILSLRWQNYRLCSSCSKSVSLLERYIFLNPRTEALSYHCPHWKKRIWDVPTILTHVRSGPP